MASSSGSQAVDVRRALLEDLVSRQPVLALVNAAIGTAFALMYLPVRPLALIVGWISAMVLVQAVRLVGWWDCRRRLRQGILAGLSARLIAGSLATGCLWGVAGWAMFVPDPPYNAIVPFTLAGMVAGAVLTLPSHAAAFYAFYIPALIPYALRLMLEPSSARQLMALITLVFCLAIGLIGYQQRRGLVRVARLSRQNADLVGQLQEASRGLERRVEERTAELQVANDRLAAEIAERARSEAQIRHILDHDPLTGLPNRRLLVDRIGQALARARREGEGVAVMMLDLDDFKSINDHFGHPAGDTVLRAVAHRLRDALRETDTVARMGGDEFAVVQVGLDEPEGALVLARKLHAQASLPVRLEAGETAVRVSIGVALFPVDGPSPAELLKRADIALYAVKRRRSGGVTFYDSRLDRATSDRRRLEQELRTGLDAEQFTLVYQPRLRLDGGGMPGVEALLRWNHPERGQLPAEAFIDAAEASGLIRPIGAWALERACRDLVEVGQGAQDLQLAVNLSDAELREPGFPELLERILTGTGLAGRRLELEVAEATWADQHAEAVGAALEAIRRQGVRIALDRLGTGDLPLARLAGLPVDIVKIDRRLVAAVSTGASDRAVVAAAVALARTCGHQVVGVGIERDDQLAALRELGCDQGQGLLLGPPVAAAELAGLRSRALAMSSLPIS